MWICTAPHREHTSKVLRYGVLSQGISQFYLHTPHSSSKQNEPYLPFPSQLKAGTHLPTPEGWKAELALAASGYIPK